ncbi:hypothetical protein Q5H91_00945 [Sphingomonas sp. KR1UV-12]|uniref:UrcA family protein n=1 Tax=Sphingomonas aurea TaxID=3063994 RepID=A0ABT9EFM8_9SPHN|nr:hypothetical protein [Sphingomonas sp. KR1UV-12]MDP1025769.1 hypothetical protein [Sphingomonas sp. KR1UV-12]
MTAKTIILGSFVAMMLTTAATAAPVETAAATVDAGLNKSTVATARADSPDQRYCIVQEPATGSHVRRRTCDTLSAWQEQGVDPRLMPRRR